MKWDGRFYSVSIDPSGNKELYEELVDLQPKVRAERLKILATVGLATLRGGYPAGAENNRSTLKQSEPSNNDSDKVKSAREKARKNLGDKLLKGL